jgi:EmrB/QacA subfamily drug resistance transporter
MAALENADLATSEAPKTPRSLWYALGFISMGVTMVMIDATIVNVAIPQVSADLNLVPTDIQWINSIYALVFAALLITMGKLGDSVGRRRIFLTGVTIFVLASVIAATAQSGQVVIAGRALQGIGGAMMIPASLSLLNTMFRGRERAIAFAIWGATVGTVAALGPLLGGYLTSTYSWRWAFLINVPVAIISVIGVRLLAPESKDTESRPGVDLPGVLLSALGLGALIFGLIEGQNYGWWAPRGDNIAIGPFSWPFTAISPVPVAFVISAIAIYSFIVVEKRRAAAGRIFTLDVTLFSIRSFSWGNIIGLCIMFGEFGMILTLPLFLQNVLGYTALRAGATTAFIMVGALIAAPASGSLTQKKGPLFVVRLGLSIEVVAMIGVGLTYSSSASQWGFAPWLALFGAGIGLGTAQLVNVILRDVPVMKSGQASGTQSTSRQVGTALGVAILGTVLWTSLGSLLTTNLQTQAGLSPQQAQQVSDQVVSSSGVTINSVDVPPNRLLVAQYGPEVEATAQEAFAQATARATFVGAGFVAVGVLGTLVGMRRREDEQDHSADDAERAAGAAPEPAASDTSASLTDAPAQTTPA